MSGKTWLLGVPIALLIAGCARNVPQDSHSGKDFSPKGAKTIALEGGEGSSRKDIVTYPGGDRVDWKVLEIPEGPKGVLEVKIHYKSPRPGLDLAFSVFDADFHEVGAAGPTPKDPEGSKSVKVDPVGAGTYYLQVYAPERGDAAEYLVMVRFKEADLLADAGGAAEPSDIPFPPSLPAVPEAEPDAPPPPPPEDPPGGTTPPDPIEDPVVAAEPVKAKVMNYQVSSSGLIITLDKGADAGIDRGWSGVVLRGSSDTTLDGGEFKIIKVTATRAVGKVNMSVDQIKANRYVLIQP